VINLRYALSFDFAFHLIKNNDGMMHLFRWSHLWSMCHGRTVQYVSEECCS